MSYDIDCFYGVGFLGLNFLANLLAKGHPVSSRVSPNLLMQRDVALLARNEVAVQPTGNIFWIGNCGCKRNELPDTLLAQNGA
jgi:hypothetical protein